MFTEIKTYRTFEVPTEFGLIVVFIQPEPNNVSGWVVHCVTYDGVPYDIDSDDDCAADVASALNIPNDDNIFTSILNLLPL